MEAMEEKLGAILSNPQLMDQIRSMAQSMGLGQPEEPPREPDPPVMPELNPALLQQMMSLAGQTGIDRNQQALLSALRPYLTGQRIRKLEKAMRAAKLAGFASTALSSGALSFLTGR